MFCCKFFNLFLQGGACFTISKPVFVIYYPKIIIAVRYNCVGWGCDYVVMNVVFDIIIAQEFY